MKKSCCVGEKNSLGERVLWPDGKITCVFGLGEFSLISSQCVCSILHHSLIYSINKVIGGDLAFGMG